MTKIKSKCGHEVEKSDTFCGTCGEKVVHVELEHESSIKRCPSCEKPLLTLNVSFCTGCGEKIFICKGKNENGSSCESLVALSSNFELCKKCRLSVGVQIENNACNDGKIYKYIYNQNLNFRIAIFSSTFFFIHFGTF